MPSRYVTAAMWLRLRCYCSCCAAQGAAEPETARVYQEFLKTFQPEDPSADKAFVRGEVNSQSVGLRF